MVKRLEVGYSPTQIEFEVPWLSATTSSSSASGTAYDRGADDVAVRKPDGRLTPARFCEPARRLTNAVVGEKEVWAGTLEGDDLQRRLGLNGFHEVKDLVVHPVVHRVDRCVVEGRAPVAGHLVVDRHVGRRLAQRHCPASAVRASAAMSALVLA